MSPIRPEMKPLYPKDWKAIRAEVLARAKNRCEWEGCGVENHAWGIWGDNVFLKLTKGELDAAYADGEKTVMIVLTIAHLDQNPANNGTPGNRPNLMALCQRHHNRLDAPHRARGIKERFFKRVGQESLLAQAAAAVLRANLESA